jgi:hypothetical protein
MPKPVPYATTDESSKLCTKCGGTFLLDLFYTTGKKVSGAPKYNSWCKSCISDKQSSYHKRTWGPNRLQHSAVKRTKSVRSYLNYLRGKASQRGKGDVVSVDALEMLWHNQGGRCALTGWDMTMELGRGTVPTNCSLDRIDSSQGYEVGNVQLVCRAANVAKSDLTVNDFVALCRSVMEVHHG